MVLVLAVLLPPGVPARGQGPDPGRVAAVKSGMIVNFVRYTTWPESSFEREGAPIIIAVVGETDLEGALEAAVRGQTVNGRPVELRRLRYPPPAPGRGEPPAEQLEELHRAIRSSHVVYFGSLGGDRVASLLEAVRGADVLTVSAADGFAEQGGMLGLVVGERRISFEANPDEIEETRLRVSSQVLRLARLVRTRPEQAEGTR